MGNSQKGVFQTTVAQFSSLVWFFLYIFPIES